MRIKPLFDKVVIEAENTETATKSGIVLPSAAQEKPVMAKVVAVGPGGFIDGHDVKMTVKVGDVVLYSKYSANDFKFDGKEVKIIRQSDILAVIEK